MFITKKEFAEELKKQGEATNTLFNRLRSDLEVLERYLEIEKRKRAVLRKKYYCGFEIGEEAVVEEYYAKKENKRGRPKGSKNKK